MGRTGSSFEKTAGQTRDEIHFVLANYVLCFWYKPSDRRDYEVRNRKTCYQFSSSNELIGYPVDATGIIIFCN